MTQVLAEKRQAPLNLFGESATIREILRQGYKSYEKSHPLPDHVRNAVYYQLICRTKYLGGHSQRCPDGHYIKSHYNSCRHRFCPQCGSIKKERWVRDQEARQLNCDYYHLIFTIDHDFNDIWLTNEKEMTSILMLCAREVIMILLADKRYLGAMPGITVSLHTWSQTMIEHPHCHFLVTGGGLTDTGEWKHSSNGFLLPVKVAMKMFRTKFRWAVRKGVLEGKLKLPKGMDIKAFRKLLVETGKKKWNVNVRERYEHGRGVMRYIARYIRGGCISNKRILSIKEGMVTFSYKNNKKEGKQETMCLTLEEFIQRYLLHVPPPGSHRVRHYGLHASTKKEELNKCRALLGQPPVEKPEELDWKEYCAQMGHEYLERCPICGKMLLLDTTIIPRANYPPLKVLFEISTMN